MPSTFTTNTGLEKIADGEQTGQWGQTTNGNFDIVDRALNGVVPIQLFSTAFTLTTISGVVSDGQASAVIFTGSIGGPATVTVEPNNAQKTYIIRNSSNQPITVTQGSGGDVVIPAGSSKIIVCTGDGATAAVFEGSTGISEVDLTSQVVNVLPVANGGTGTSSTQFVDLATNITGTTPVANGGTGRSTLASGNLILGNGTNQVTQLAGTSIGQVPQWNGTTWGVGSLPSGGVTNVTASSPLASSGGATPNITFTGILPLGNGGTGTTSASSARTNLGLGTMATQNSNNVSITGGSITGIAFPTQTQATWQAGTGTTESVVSPAKVKAAITALMPASYSDAQARAAQAGHTVGGIGSYILGAAEVNLAVGATVAGSSLRSAGAHSEDTSNRYATITGALLSGTWRCMGTNTTSGTYPLTLYLRIS